MAPHRIHGSLETEKGVPILRLWGSHHDMGYAHGYYNAGYIVSWIEDSYYKLRHYDRHMTYEQLVARMNRYIRWSDKYREEAQGCLEGINAALHRLPIISSPFLENGSKTLDVEMLLLHNCYAPVVMAVDTARINPTSGRPLPDLFPWCTGFAAWGTATDGNTRVGGNVDFFPDKADSYLLVVRKPDDGLATACYGNRSLFLGGDCGAMKGMNESGLALTTHGAYGLWPPWTHTSKRGGAINLRDIMENVSAGRDMFERITAYFRRTQANMAGTYIFAQKTVDGLDSHDPKMGVVIEKDCEGFDYRLSSDNIPALPDALVATNHYLKRKASTAEADINNKMFKLGVSKYLYRKMFKVVKEHNISDVSKMQNVLQASAKFGYVTTIVSMYMEPDNMTMHVGLFIPGSSAPYQEPVKFTWDELIAPMPS